MQDKNDLIIWVNGNLCLLITDINTVKVEIIKFSASSEDFMRLCLFLWN